MKVGTTLVFTAMIVVGMSNVTFGYYNQSLGRWTSEDPLGTDPAGGLHGNAFVTTTQYDDGVSLYNYVGGYSLIAGDPYGLEYVVNGHMPPYMDSTTARVPWWAWLPQDGAGRIALRNIRASAMLLAGQWNARGWTEAGTALLNYVTAGNSISVSYAKMLKEAADPAVQIGYLDEVREALSETERIVTEDGTTNLTRTQWRGINTQGFSLRSSDNWAAAVGGHYIWGNATVSKRGCCYRMELNVQLDDVYDFDGWRNPLQLLEAYGMAKRFRTSGSHSVTLIWKKGDTQSVVDRSTELLVEGNTVNGGAECQ